MQVKEDGCLSLSLFSLCVVQQKVEYKLREDKSFFYLFLLFVILSHSPPPVFIFVFFLSEFSPFSPFLCLFCLLSPYRYRFSLPLSPFIHPFILLCFFLCISHHLLFFAFLLPFLFHSLSDYFFHSIFFFLPPSSFCCSLSSFSFVFFPFCLFLFLYHFFFLSLSFSISSFLFLSFSSSFSLLFFSLLLYLPFLSSFSFLSL
ncbi:unnamed protein product [Acanthosepion pharaonis]|uniref:Uncharacterized protein n=1 Tax=Acanthosepion pharaonis TaxID=158019 RepID=A0A812DDP5_ACAPH|nr:unnamed protein product [Sepia pharaonis]